MKKRKLLCMILCCGLLLAMLAACDNGDGKKGDESADPSPPAQESPTPPPPAALYSVDFADGNTSFLMINTGTPGTDQESSMAIGSVGGESVLKLTAPNGKSLRLGINVEGLLGSRAVDVRTIVIDVYAEYPDGSFSAVSGRVAAMTVDSTPFAETNWQIYLESRNPNQAVLEFGEDYAFSPGGPSIIEFSCTTNGPADRGETPAVICIKSITFFDAGNTAIQVDTKSGWSAPDGYGEFVVLGGWILPNPPHDGNPGGWQTWLSPGVDGKDFEDMPWEVVAASFGIVFEMEQPETFEFVYFGAFNGWSWTQTQIADYWADGKIEVLWEDIGFDPTLINEDDNGVKLAMGNWNEVPVDVIYLLYDEDALP